MHLLRKTTSFQFFSFPSMDLNTPTSLIFCFLLFLYMFIKIGKRAKNQDSVNSKLPPGPWKLPIIGSIHHLRGALPHHCLRDLANRYGPVMHMQLGEVPTIVVSSAEGAAEVMKTHDIIFAQRPRLYCANINTYGNTDVAFAPYGPYWRQLRKICVSELLTAKRVESFNFVREEEMSSLISSIRSSCESPINLTSKFYSLTNNIIARAAFGNINKHKDLFMSTLAVGMEISGGFIAADLFPSSKLIPVITGIKHKMEENHRQLDRILCDIVEEHRHKSVIAKENQQEVEEDLIDVLLRLQQSGELEVPMSIDNVKAVILDMFAAGTDTSATVLTWAMAELMRNPAAMDKAQEEVRRAFGGKKKVGEEDLDELNYLKSVVKETLRLHPPLPLLLPRECRESCEINEFKIPQSARVIVNVWAISRDSNNWGDDAESFRPERFLNNWVDFKGVDMEFTPFGAGRRICPGMLFGIANVQLPLAKLLYYFDWKLPGEKKAEDLDMAEKFGPIVSRKSDLYLVPVSYNPMHKLCKTVRSLVDV